MSEYYRLSFLTELRIRLRTRFYLLFKKHRLPEKISIRKGECNRCGACCRVTIFGVKCPFFQEKENTCKLYGTKFMLKGCKLFPFDLQNRYEGKVKEIEDKCGYYW